MWTVIFNQNTDKPGVGTFVATNDGFSFSADQVDSTDEKSVDEFVAAAKAAFAEALVKRAGIESAVAVVQGKFNKV